MVAYENKIKNNARLESYVVYVQFVENAFPFPLNSWVAISACNYANISVNDALHN